MVSYQARVVLFLIQYMFYNNNLATLHRLYIWRNNHFTVRAMISRNIAPKYNTASSIQRINLDNQDYSPNQVVHPDANGHRRRKSLFSLFRKRQKSNMYVNHGANRNMMQNITKNNKNRSDYYRDMFIYKLKRTLQSHQPPQILQEYTDIIIKSYSDSSYSIFSYSRHKPLRYLQGIQLTNFIVNLIIFLGNLVTLILLVLSTFQGFIQEFSMNQTKHWAVITLKIFCLLTSFTIFVIKCTCRYAHGEYKIYMYQIFLAYVKSFRFYLDLVSILFQIAILIWSQVMAISGVYFFFLILILNLTINDSIGLQIIFVDRQKHVLTIQALKIAFSNIIFGHLMASFLLAMSRIDLENNWIIQLQIQNQRWYVIYINAFYWGWGYTLMMTVGFGDVLPSNTGEKLVTAFLQIFSCALLGYNISAIGALITQIRNHNRRTNRKRAVFRKMVRSSKTAKPFITKRLEIQILQYIKSTSSGSLNLQYEQRDILIKSLPQNLRKQFYKQLCPKIFPNVAFFNRLKYSTLRLIAQKFVRRSYFTRQYLLQNISQQILLLDAGKIGLAYKNKSSTINGEVFESFQIQQGQQLVLITPYLFNLSKKANYYLISKLNTLTWSITYNDFIQCLKQDQADYQYYFSVYHSHKIDYDFYNFIKCVRCSNKSIVRYHSVYDCPRLCYLPIRELIGLRFAKDEGRLQYRVPYARKKHISTSISSLKQIRQLKKISEYNQQLEYITQAFIEDKNLTYQIHRNHVQFKDIQEIQRQDYQQNRKLINKTNKYQMKNLIQSSIKKYDLGYQDGFWFLETDLAYNYEFYFNNFSPYRVHKIKLYPRSQKSVRNNNKGFSKAESNSWSGRGNKQYTILNSNYF